MKKTGAVIKAVLFAAAVCMMMAGCSGGETKEIAGDVKNNVVSSTAEQESEVGNAQYEAKSNETAAEATAFSYNGTEIVIDAEAADILEALGEPISEYEAPNCAFGDLDVIYTYAGFEVDTYRENDVDYITSVLLMDDSVETPEGLYIGADAENVKALYGEPTEENASSMTYAYDTMNFVIILDGGKVSSIQYLNLRLQN